MHYFSYNSGLLIRPCEVLSGMTYAAVIKGSQLLAPGFYANIAMCSLAAARSLALVCTSTRLPIACFKSALSRSSAVELRAVTGQIKQLIFLANDGAHGRVAQARYLYDSHDLDGLFMEPHDFACAALISEARTRFSVVCSR